jgi:hypothetical protein
MIKKIEGEKNDFKKKSPRAKKILSVKRATWLTLGEEFFAEIFFLSVKKFFAESFILCREYYFSLAKEIFAESKRLSSRRRILLSAKPRFP